MPELKPLPCPHCSSLSIGLCSGGDEITHEVYNQAFCTSCGVRGPRVFGDDLAAIAAWNSLLRALRWADEPPSVAAGYYTRDIRHKDEAGIIQISSQQAESLSAKGSCKFIQYAGPIPSPLD